MNLSKHDFIHSWSVFLSLNIITLVLSILRLCSAFLQ